MWRLALARDLTRLAATPEFAAFFPPLIERVSGFEVLDGAGKPLVLTLVRLISNALPSPTLVAALLGKPSLLEGVTRVMVRALLDGDKGVRSAGAGLGWSLVGRVWNARGSAEGEVGGEEWEVEVASAVLEALGREGESVEVGEWIRQISEIWQRMQPSLTSRLPLPPVHRLAATLGLLIFQSPHHEAIKSLLEVLEVVDVLKGKELLVEQLAGAGKKDVEQLLREVEQLCA